MNKNHRIKIITLAVTLILISNISISIAKETIPIPSKRPAVLNVSPAYIEELRNRGRASILPLPDEIIDGVEGDLEIIEEKDSPDAEIADVEIADVEITDVEIADVEITDAEIADVEIAKITPPAMPIPIPSHKPSFNNISPSSGTSGAIDDDKNNETTIISFSLEPEIMVIDKSLEEFLKTSAVKLFNENKNLKMEINAYATAIKGEPHSDVRIALARALKVRSFLIDNDIAPNRLKLTPKGNKTSADNIDRIDLIFIETE